MAVTVRLTKTGGDSGVCVFGRLEKGTVLDIRIPDRIVGEQEKKIRARKMMERDHSDENQMEWEAEILPYMVRRQPGEVFAETDPEHWPDGRPTYGQGR